MSLYQIILIYLSKILISLFPLCNIADRKVVIQINPIILSQQSISDPEFTVSSKSHRSIVLVDFPCRRGDLFCTNLAMILPPNSQLHLSLESTGSARALGSSSNVAFCSLNVITEPPGYFFDTAVQMEMNSRTGDKTSSPT